MEKPNIVKIVDCQYDEFAGAKEACNTAATHLDRANGILVCGAHSQALESVFENQDEIFMASAQEIDPDNLADLSEFDLLALDLGEGKLEKDPVL